MEKVVISDLHPHYDGEYEFDTDEFTHGELHTIKKISGVRLGELEEALNANDADVTMALVVVCLQREGKEIHEDVFWNAKAGSLRIVSEPDPVPPTKAPASEDHGSGQPSSLDETPTPSGNGTASSSATPDSVPESIGSPPSVPSAKSELATSAK